MEKKASTAESAPLDALRSPTDKGVSYDGNPLPRLLALLRLESRDLWVVTIYSVGIGLTTLVVPISVQAVVNFIAFGSMIQPLIILTLFVGVALGLSAVMNAFRVLAVEIIQRRLCVRVTTDFAQRLVSVKTEVFDRLYGPELVNRFFDVVTVQKSAAALLMDGLSLAMQTVLGLLLLAVYHPLLLAFDALLLAVMALIFFVLGRGAVPTAIRESKAKYSIAAWLEEISAHIPVFKSASGRSYALGRVDGLAQEYLDRRKAHFRVVMRQVVGSLALQAVASALLLGIGGFLVMQGQLTLGQLVAAELIVTTVVSGFSRFGKKLETYYDLLAALDKLGNVIDLPSEEGGRSEWAKRSGPASVQLRGLTLTSAAGAGESLELTLDPGTSVGVTGPGGSGKSNLADVLCGLRRPASGVVMLNGLDTRDLATAALLDGAALVRGPEILSDSVARNVSLGRPGVGLEEITGALAAVGLLDDILAMPQGLQTGLRAGAAPGLTRPQAICLTLARAIAGKPSLLVVDEALDGIKDEAVREAICKTLFAPKMPWTLVCITNDPDLLSRCERTVQLSRVAKGDREGSNR
ncbi:MAG: ATP-binding cassette domain-containing protein [Acidobacteria bacterium]|nr:ATP-binding cassette domain-containing protein [Acidobacteriota bacterium]